jgi:hypothetical protein
LYNILDSKIMDKFIYDKWTGRVEFNSVMMDYSSAYNLFMDRHKLYQSDRLLDQLYQDLFDFDRREKTHEFKFHVWKKSMSLRYGIEFFFVLILTIFFQVKIGQFVQNLGHVKSNIHDLTAIRRTSGRTKEYLTGIEELKGFIHHTDVSLQGVLIVP